MQELERIDVFLFGWEMEEGEIFRENSRVRKLVRWVLGLVETEQNI